MVTVTLKVPAVAMSAVVMAAVTSVADTKVVLWALPFQLTVTPDVKLVSFTVRVKAGPPAMAEVGLMEAILGEATVIESAADKASAWRPAWGEARRKQIAREDFVLVHFRPRRLEIVSYAHDLTNDPKTMLPVILDLP